MADSRSPTVLVAGKPGGAQLAMLKRLPAGTRVVAGDRAGAFGEAAAEAEVLLSWFAPGELVEAVVERAPRLRWVHSASVGVDTLLVPALARGPAVLTNARGIYSAALGEFAVAAMLFFAKDLRRMVASQRAGRWDPFEVEMLNGKVLGIAGYGGIGQAVAERARALGMRVFALRKHGQTDEMVERAYPSEERLAMLAEADYVLAALPLTQATRGFIGERELAAMKPTAVLINLGRGPVVDEAALVRALEEKRIRGAALDVFDQEPLPAGHPFYRLENVLLSPHCADHTAGWTDQTMELFLENFERFTRGEPLKNVVDKSKGY